MSSPICRKRIIKNITAASPTACSWPILHYRIDLTEFTRRDLTGYFRVNRHFATELAKIVQPDDMIWVHDYHLIPIANELRERGFANRIGFFLHVPFPAPEVVAVLPNCHRRLPLLLQYDLVGFQTEIDVGNFVRYLLAEYRGPSRRVFEATTVEFVFSYSGRQTRIGAFPVGIDTNEFQRLARKAVRSSFVQGVIESLGRRALLIGVDRLDYSKGLIQRMEAFEHFLRLHPQWANKVTYLQIAPKSRSEIPEYHDLERDVGAAAGRINGAFGDVSWTPIRYHNRSYGRSGLAGLLPLGLRGPRHAFARRHESRGQGIHRRTRRRGSRRARSLTLRRRRSRMCRSLVGQSL